MLEPSKIIATIADANVGPEATALMRISEILKLHDQKVTIVAQQSVQDLDAEDIFIGSAGMRLRGVYIPYKDLKIVTHIPHKDLPSKEDIMAGEACVFSYRTDEQSFLTVTGRDVGRQLKMRYAEEAIDVAATSSLNTGSRILMSENADDECEVLDVGTLSVNEDGLSFGPDRLVPWTEISAMTIQDTLSIAIGRQRMMTISES